MTADLIKLFLAVPGVAHDSQSAAPWHFAKHIGVTRVTLFRILNGRAGITPDMSNRIAEAFGQPSRDIWFKMQNDYDFSQAAKAGAKRLRASK